MQSVSAESTVRVGNHALTAQEAAAGAPERDAFVDAAGEPVDPDGVALVLTAPTGQSRTFAWPTAGPTDTGAMTQEETGRFYADWTPHADEDGLWRWALVGGMSLGTAHADQDVFFVKRPIAPGA